ncbi:MAG: integration host factor subunit beta [Candidatus Desulforudis sp.]|nr:integration host factor subunit beta [Desulforudis sp.]
MNKSDLIQALADKEGLTLKMAEKVVNTFFDLMAQSLAQGDRVEIRGFGSLQVKDYEGYEGLNPKTGEIIMVKPKKLPVFKVGKELKERVDIEN